MVTMILAHDFLYGIGKDGKLPWRVKADLAHFKEVTSNKDLIVGRKTAIKLPFLKGRQVHVVSKNGQSIEDVIEKVGDPIVIGGAEIYKYCLKQGLIDMIIVTVIKGIYNCDTYIDPNFLDGFKFVQQKNLEGGHVVTWYIKNNKN